MKNLYLKINEKIKASNDQFTNRNLPLIQHIDLYNGEDLLPEAYKQYPLPALFTDYKIDWEKQILNLKLHVLLAKGESTASTSANQLEALKVFDTYDLIKHLLIGLESESTGKLKLVGEESISSNIVNYQTIDFNSRIEKNSREEKFAESSIESLSITL